MAPEVMAGSRATLARLYQEQWGVGLRGEPGTDRVKLNDVSIRHQLSKMSFRRKAYAKSVSVAACTVHSM